MPYSKAKKYDSFIKFLECYVTFEINVSGKAGVD
jgi:hypothetical protein